MALVLILVEECNHLFLVWSLSACSLVFFCCGFHLVLGLYLGCLSGVGPSFGSAIGPVLSVGLGLD